MHTCFIAICFIKHLVGSHSHNMTPILLWLVRMQEQTSTPSRQKLLFIKKHLLQVSVMNIRLMTIGKIPHQSMELTLILLIRESAYMKSGKNLISEEEPFFNTKNKLMRLPFNSISAQKHKKGFSVRKITEINLG